MSDFPSAGGAQNNTDQIESMVDILSTVSEKLDNLHEDNTAIIGLLKAVVLGLEVISDVDDLMGQVEED